MSVELGAIDADQQPPMTVPLQYFVVGLGFLALGVLAGLSLSFDLVPGTVGPAHVHLLLVGWVCLTIMGSMTQFVPVWSGVPLHSRQLATRQLWLIVVGVLGFAGSLLSNAPALQVGFGALMLGGFWVFVYNLGRTLWGIRTYDVTERHFAATLGFFAIVPGLGYLLVLDGVWPILEVIPIARSELIAAHATLAVFGTVITPMIGALYQLGPMFTQTDLPEFEPYLRRAETVAYPAGVVLLATARLLGLEAIGWIGGVLVTVSLLGVSVSLARRLLVTRVDWTPMLTRYAIAALALGLWSLLALVAWSRVPLATAVRFGAVGTGHLLGLGVVGFVVFGSLYHIIPFIIWVHRYSDRLGLEDVPMVADLYDERLAVLDFGLLLAGLIGMIAATWFGLPPSVTLAAGGLVCLGTLVFSGNMLLVIHTHSPSSLGGILWQSGAAHHPEPGTASEPNDPSA